jgi:hypothetical protein
MTVMIDRFFGMPPGIIRLGTVKSLSGVAIKLYMALWHESERKRTRLVRCTTAELEQLTGCSRNALTTARTDLAHAGLLQAERYGQQSFALLLCDPETGKPWPGDPKERILYQKKIDASPPVATDVVTASKPRIDSGVEVAALQHPQTENRSRRDGSVIDKRPATVPVLRPTARDVVERIDTSDEIGLGGISFPFGYNDLISCKRDSHPIMESLRGVFD